MFGLNFVQQAFLLAGAAAAVPIAIHLLLRQRAQVVEIGSVRFLQRLMRQHNRIRRLRQWLLLACRVLACLLLAALFARPFFDRSAVEASQQSVAILLDHSASMQLRSGDRGSLFDAAREAAEQALADCEENVAVRVALFDAERVTELEPQELARIEHAGHGGTDYAQALAWARDALQQMGRPEKRVLLFSDLQRSGLAKRLADFPPDVQVEVHAFGRPVARNVAIQQAIATAVEIRPKLPPTVAVELANSSPLRVDDVRLVLQLEGPNGELSTEKEVSLAGGDRVLVEFPLTDVKPGRYAGFAELQLDDDLICDNRRYLAFDVRLPDRVLIVDGQVTSSVFASETYFLETALQLGRQKQTASRDVPTFETERIVWENGEGFPSLEGFRVIILANVGRYSELDLRRLREYVHAGGAVLFFAGDQVTERVAEQLHVADLLPGRWQHGEQTGIYRLASWNEEHPIFQPFDNPQYGDLRRLQFRRIVSSEPAAAAKVLATVSGGESLMLEKQLGNGRTVLVTTTADRDWSDWPQSRLYVPLVRQIMAYLTGQHLRDSRVMDETAGSGEGTAPGIARLGEHVIVRNVPVTESHLTLVSAEEFREALALPDVRPSRILTPEQAAALAPPPGSERANERWTTILWIVLAVLIAETFLAGRAHI